MIGIRLLALLIAMLPFAAFAQVNSLPSQPHLLVKGEAVRTVVPDRFTVKVSLQAIDVAPEKARASVQADAELVLRGFRAHHAMEDSIQASNLAIQPDYDVEQGRRVFRGTKVRRRLEGTFDSLENTRGFLADMETSEQLQLSGIETAYSDEAGVRAELKREAAVRTRESAEQLAHAYGVRISGLYTISDVAPKFSYGIQAGSWPRRRSLAIAPAPPAPQMDIAARVESLEAGSIVLSEHVYAVFLIAQ